ncbi:MAG: bifunctional UDP-3-O-[3-hydroxymyristoyl] N-acetylglucosamine deacetylase/3-hydroxyacyl-ACP dehydratase [bacterium]
MPRQLTIAEEVSLKGTGLHSGKEAQLIFRQLPENGGIWFRRMDIEGKPRIKADIDNVKDISRGTTLGDNGVKVQTVEHLMAALFACDIDNILIDMKGEELPIFDGSAHEYFQAIKRAGIKEQEAEKRYIVIKEPILFEQDDKAISLFRCEQFRLTFMIDYNHPALGAQHTTIFHMGEFESEYSKARTFCFLSEIEDLREKNLIRGGSLNCAVVVQDKEVDEKEIEYLRSLFDIKESIKKGENGFLNNCDLRFPNELCRHKAVDLMGDFYLLGAPIRGQVLAARSGHAANIEMAKKIRKAGLRPVVPGSDERAPLMDIEDIKKILPHRYPFLLVDRVVEVERNKRIRAYKNLTVNEEFFQGHFPHYPIMPGVLQVEAMAQTGGLLMAQNIKNFENMNTIFMSINNCKFRRPVRPGDQMIIEVEILQLRRGICRMQGRTMVDGKIAAEADLMVSAMPKQK